MVSMTPIKGISEPWNSFGNWKIMQLHVKQRRCDLHTVTSARPTHTHAAHTLCRHKTRPPKNHLLQFVLCSLPLSFRSNQKERKYFTQQSVVWLKCNLRTFVLTKSISSTRQQHSEEWKSFCRVRNRFEHVTKWAISFLMHRIRPVYLGIRSLSRRTIISMRALKTAPLRLERNGFALCSETNGGYCGRRFVTATLRVDSGA